MKNCVNFRTFAQILLFALASCAEVSASEIPSKATHMYTSGGLAAATRRTANAATPLHKILNSGGVVSNAQKFSEVARSQPAAQSDVKSINYIDQIKSVLDATGLQHFKQCTRYLIEEDMGIKNTKLKAGLLQGFGTPEEIKFSVKRPSKNACKELFKLIQN